MKSAFVLAVAAAALCAASAMAQELDTQVDAALKAFGIQAAAQKKDTAVQVGDLKFVAEQHGFEHRGPERGDHDRGNGRDHDGGRDRGHDRDHDGGRDRGHDRDHDRREPDHRGPDRREPEHREPEHRFPEPRFPEHRRGRWEHGVGSINPWRPVHFTRYLGYSWDIEECRDFGRAEGFPYVIRYNLSGDCYGDIRPF
jgi:hypothetical protein